MKKRMNLPTAIMLGVLLVVLAFAAAACGSAAQTTTTAAPTTTTSAAATTTTAAGATGSVTVPSIQMTPELTAYLTQMQTVFGGLQSLPDTSNPLKVADISKVTDADIQTYDAALAQIKTALDGMKALKPPAELAAFQETLVQAIQSEIDIAGKAIDALKNKDQAAFDAAKADSDKLDAQMNTLLEQLVPLMTGGTATT